MQFIKSFAMLNIWSTWRPVCSVHLVDRWRSVFLFLM